MKKILPDKLLLIVVGVTIFVSGFLIFFYVKSLWRKSIGEEWTDFIIASVFYLVSLLAVTFISKEFKQVKKLKLLLCVVILYSLTIGIAYALFIFNILPMPEHHRIYILAIIVLGASTEVLLGYCVKKLKFFHDNIRKQKLYDSE